jgi:ribosomal protein S18 acetylase RimI-like enzyme
MTTVQATVARVTEGVHWHALEDDVVVGRGYALHRPDGRVFVSADTWRDDVFELLGEAMLADLGRPVFTLVAEDDVEHLGRWSALGFVDHRLEDEYLVPTGAPSGAAAAGIPAGYTLHTAGEVPEDALRELDERLRQDVPGSAGWVNTPEGFREANFSPGFYDPATYLVARHGEELAGLVRVWRGRVPKLGLVGVLPGHRGRGLARALVTTVFGVLRERGVATVFAEVDRTDEASQSLLGSLGARRAGGVLELVRRP